MRMYLLFFMFTTVFKNVDLWGMEASSSTAASTNVPAHLQMAVENVQALRQALFDQACTLIHVCRDMLMPRSNLSEAAIRIMTACSDAQATANVIRFLTTKTPLTQVQYNAVLVNRERIQELQKLALPEYFDVSLKSRIAAYESAVAALQ